MKLGICLSGGGIRGFSHIGALIALEQAGIKPDLISGASAGSIIAALYSYGMSFNDMIDCATSSTKNMYDINYLGILKALVKAPFLKELRIDGLIKGDKIEKLVFDVTGGANLSKLKIPTAILGTDINQGRQVVYTNATLPESEDMVQIKDTYISHAVRASIAIPGVFAPQHTPYNGTELTVVDGGVKDNLPFDLLMSMGADKVIAFNLGYNGQLDSDMDGLVEILSQTVDLFVYNVVELNKQKYGILECKDGDCSLDEASSKQILIVNPKIYNVSLLDSSKIYDVIIKGKEVTEKAMPIIKEFLNS